MALLFIYVLYLLFQLKSHAYLTRSIPQRVLHVESQSRALVQRNYAPPSPRSSISSSLPPSPESETENVIKLNIVDSQEPLASRALTNIDSEMDEPVSNDGRLSQGRVSSSKRSVSRNKAPQTNPVLCPVPLRTHSAFIIPSASQHSLPGHLNQDLTLHRPRRPGLPEADFPSFRPRYSARQSSDYPTVDRFTLSVTNTVFISRTASLILLIASSSFAGICAEFLVDSIDDMVKHGPFSEIFVGLIILPLAGNVAEHITAMTIAAKNNMDLAIGVSVGSSIQIALFVTPLVIIVGWILDRDMSLYFNLFETVTLVASAFVVNFLILNGKTNYLEGALLCACYIIVALVLPFHYLQLFSVLAAANASQGGSVSVS